jgi:hypothetical protein
MAVLFRPEHEDGTPAEPRTFEAAVPNWSPAATIPPGRNLTLRDQRSIGDRSPTKDPGASGRTRAKRQDAPPCKCVSAPVATLPNERITCRFFGSSSSSFLCWPCSATLGGDASLGRPRQPRDRLTEPFRSQPTDGRSEWLSCSGWSTKTGRRPIRRPSGAPSRIGNRETRSRSGVER